MERELGVKCLFDSFLLKLPHFDYIYLYHTHKKLGFQQNYIYFQFVLYVGGFIFAKKQCFYRPPPLF